MKREGMNGGKEQLKTWGKKKMRGQDGKVRKRKSKGAQVRQQMK